MPIIVVAYPERLALLHALVVVFGPAAVVGIDGGTRIAGLHHVSALEHATAALAVAREAGYRPLEEQALAELAEVDPTRPDRP